MSISLTVLYNPPADAAAFDKHYDEVHAPLAAKLPNLESFTIVRPGPGPDGSAPQYHLIATLTFDSAEAMQASMGGPEGKAATDDLANFAQAGVTILTGEVQQVV
ncbi:EthD family reductase [Pseudonocardia kujensis]|uniref:EthD family reductase n=1 Tax=Pseudonocardia kujensis TaxID=1128675 RepID=UPI001E2BDE38|nr:EthD family reductase [Pseudonocardia kujensis]MCE0764064.1 EthD family reductase [Pseudonocardia kujensis]